MPLYEYLCSCGHKFEQIKLIDKRHEGVCPKCGDFGQLLPSMSMFRMAEAYSVVDSDGKVCHTRQTTEKTPPPKYGYDKEV